ncbi:hypothetical protein [Streptomyces barkulensis]|uniref:hypothetical protein n=1 Tax=Streptomyces barkulensis TaxID=1257026 RepID=UPI000C6D03FE|nr:hypothetical protein [Streptomyces barkulensis]
MRARTVVRWLVMAAVPVFALAHGFAGAATHLPDHPDHALAAVAGSFSGSGTDEHGGHDGASCEVVTGGGSHQPPLIAGGRVVAQAPPGDGTGPCGGAVSSRSPPGPSPVALSVLRI